VLTIASSALISPVVVVIGNVEVTKVNVTELIIVANEGRLPVVVEVVP
jgi:hypothetical protein